MASSAFFNLCRLCLSHGFTTELNSMFSEGSKHVELVKKLVGVDVSADKGKYDALICKACTEKLEVLGEFHRRATLADSIYFKTTRTACDGISGNAKVPPTDVLSKVKEEAAGPIDFLSMSIKQEHKVDSFDASFVSRIPFHLSLEFDDKLRTTSSLDSVQPQEKSKRTKRDKIEKIEKTEQNSRSKGRKSSKKVKCPTCDIEIAKVSLKAHIRRVHEKEKSLKCGFCTKSFVNVGEFQKHNLTVHREIFHNYFKKNAPQLMDSFENSIVGFSDVQ